MTKNSPLYLIMRDEILEENASRSTCRRIMKSMDCLIECLVDTLDPALDEFPSMRRQRVCNFHTKVNNSQGARSKSSVF